MSRWAAQPSGEELSTPTSRAHAAQVAALNRFEQQWIDIARHYEHYTPEGLAKAVSDAATEPSAAIDAATQVVTDRLQEAKDNYAKNREGLSQPGDVATELRAARFWDRTRRLLDNAEAGKLVATARETIANAGPTELPTLAEELGPYMRARKTDDSWLSGALEEADPKLAAAAQQRKLAQQAADVTSANARAIKKAFSTAENWGNWRRPRLVLPGGYDPDL
jgi:hypothetical protein